MTCVLLVLLPIDMFLTIFLIYVLLPILALRSGFHVLCKGNVTDKDVDEKIKLYKFMTNVFEALPQMILASVFLWRHYDVLYDEGIVIFTITVTSIVFSAGKLIYGIFTGSQWCYKEVKEDIRSKRMERNLARKSTIPAVNGEAYNENTDTTCSTSLV